MHFLWSKQNISWSSICSKPPSALAPGWEEIPLQWIYWVLFLSHQIIAGYLRAFFYIYIQLVETALLVFSANKSSNNRHLVSMARKKSKKPLKYFRSIYAFVFCFDGVGYHEAWRAPLQKCNYMLFTSTDGGKQLWLDCSHDCLSSWSGTVVFAAKTEPTKRRFLTQKVGKKILLNAAVSRSAIFSHDPFSDKDNRIADPGGTPPCLLSRYIHPTFTNKFWRSCLSCCGNKVCSLSVTTAWSKQRKTWMDGKEVNTVAWLTLSNAHNGGIGPPRRERCRVLVRSTQKH